ncbi:hypothetical protein [Candidatus Spongiihabitans sp.]|uniref:hypothetical protein n=1 Tax=Candidatus Spongiihabitans sp. TaxID=3101308 RepID=UPI003C7DF3C8
MAAGVFIRELNRLAATVALNFAPLSHRNRLEYDIIHFLQTLAQGAKTMSDLQLKAECVRQQMAEHSNEVTSFNKFFATCGVTPDEEYKVLEILGIKPKDT